MKWRFNGLDMTEHQADTRRRLKETAIRYVLGALAGGAALLLRVLLNPLYGSGNVYHTLWLAVVFSAWYCGIGPSLLTVTIGVLGISYWFLPPYGHLAISDPKDVFGMLGFLVFSAVIIAFGESTRRTMRKREQAEDELSKAKQDLEDRVRERTAALEKKTSELIEKAALLDLANDAIFVKEPSGKISYWNEGAERLYGWTKSEAIGRSSHELLHTVFPIPLSEIESRNKWEGELLHTRRDGTQIVVASRWTTLRDAAGLPAGWLEINTDITTRREAEDATRKLTARLLTLQDEERRRIARGLHDSLGQYLTALKINLDLFASVGGNKVAIAKECSDIIDKCLAETRTISHLLHPPLLDELGLRAAAQWFVEGFAKRSGIQVGLHLSPHLARLPRDVEIALFRAIQEALTNVHRHSDSSLVEISLTLKPKQASLAIKDNGKGIPPERLRSLQEGARNTGVGIAGMRERMRELGGSLRIESGNAGTLLTITLPLQDTPAVDSPAGNPDDTDSTLSISTGLPSTDKLWGSPDWRS